MDKISIKKLFSDPIRFPKSVMTRELFKTKVYVIFDHSSYCCGGDIGHVYV